MADRAVGVPFAKEGFPFIGAAAGVTLCTGWLGWTPVAVLAAGLTLFVSWFFRNPARVIPEGPGLSWRPAMESHRHRRRFERGISKTQSA